jgi:hypothetical protein
VENSPWFIKTTHTESYDQRRETLRKLMMIAAMLALVVVVGVAPALASDRNGHDDRFDHNGFFHNFFDNNDFFDRFFNDNPGIEQSVDQQSESGDVALGYSVQNSGDYAFQCTPAIQFGNTGNFNNAPSFLQFGGEADDFEPGGIDVSFAPQQATDCSNEIQQSSAASSYGGY